MMKNQYTCSVVPRDLGNPPAVLCNNHRVSSLRIGETKVSTHYNLANFNDPLNLRFTDSETGDTMIAETYCYGHVATILVALHVSYGSEIRGR